MWSKLRNIKLSHQGIILVSVPLLFEVVFVLSLLSLLGRAEYEARRAEHNRNVVIQTDKLVNMFYQSGTALATYDATKNPAFKLFYQRCVDRILHQEKLLRQLAQTDEKHADALSAITTSTDNVLSQLAVIDEKIDRGEPIFPSEVSKIEGLQAIGNDFAASLAELRKQQEEDELKQPKIQADLQRAVEGWLFGGVCFNVILAVFLARVFHRMTASRLTVVVSNTHRLAKQQPLEEPVSGTDEIAHLDQTFRAMARSLAEASMQKQQLLEMVSHDLRAPLSSAQMSLELMSEDAGASEKQRSELVSVQRSIKSCLHLINDLLDIEKLQAGKMELSTGVVNIELLVENAVEAIRAIIDAAKVNVRLQDCDVDVRADGNRIAQVITNLLSNAVKFSPANSEISVSVIVGKEQVRVQVRDQGPGVPADLRNVAFDRFAQLSSAARAQGSGLGLAICKAIIEQHGGQIGIEDADGGGSLFWFTLPAGDQ